MNVKGSATMNKVFLATVLSAGSVFAVPHLVTTSVTQDPEKGCVAVGYMLDAPAVVTFAVEAKSPDGSWTKVGGEATAAYAGDVNRLVVPVANVSNSFSWFPRSSWPVRMDDDTVRVVVSAWATNAPPDYMVVDLAVSNKVEYFESSAAIPGGVGDRIYKFQRMVLRKVPAAGATFRMGASAYERQSGDYGSLTTETPHEVTFTSDFYLGIYEVTYGQWQTMACPRYYAGFFTASDPSSYLLPLTSISRYGNSDTSDGLIYRLRRTAYSWPGDGHRVGDGSAMAAFRAKTGIEFDLPTEFQWEFACRAGCDGIYHDGSSCPTNVAWARYDNETGVVPVRTQEVGLLMSNAWGFYDMLGNVAEMCLNAWNSGTPLPSEAQTDPTGEGGSQFVYRGGYWNESGTKYCRSARRGGIPTGWDSNNQHCYYGIRLAAPAMAVR